MIVSEIGLNHFGDIKFLNKYINKLSKTKIDSITLQILKKQDLKRKKIQDYYLNYSEVDNFIIKVKNKNKKVGLAISDENIIDCLKNIKKIDFFKILSKDFKNTKLIKKLLNISKQKIYVAIGFSSEEDINIFLKQYKYFKKRFIFIFTSFDDKMNFNRLINIELFKKKFNVDIAYGNHSPNKKMIFFSSLFKPESIFFYVKYDNGNKYPDNFHALKINEINDYINKINKIIKI